MTLSKTNPKNYIHDASECVLLLRQRRLHFWLRSLPQAPGPQVGLVITIAATECIVSGVAERYAPRVCADGEKTWIIASNMEALPFHGFLPSTLAVVPCTPCWHARVVPLMFTSHPSPLGTSCSHRISPQLHLQLEQLIALVYGSVHSPSLGRACLHQVVARLKK